MENRTQKKSQSKPLKQPAVSKSLLSDFEKWLKKNKWNIVKAMYSKPIGENEDRQMEYEHRYIDELQREFKIESKQSNNL